MSKKLKTITPEITLPWADKFRSLCKTEGITEEQVIIKFLLYIGEQEKKISEAWKK